MKAAFIQLGGVISQTFTTAGGDFVLGFQAAQRPGNTQRLRVTVQPYPPVTTGQRFVWNGNTIAEERDSTGATVTKRFFAEGEWRLNSKGDGKYYYTRDHLGSIREVTNSSGGVRDPRSHLCIQHSKWQRVAADARRDRVSEARYHAPTRGND